MKYNSFHPKYSPTECARICVCRYALKIAERRVNAGRSRCDVIPVPSRRAKNRCLRLVEATYMDICVYCSRILAIKDLFKPLKRQRSAYNRIVDVHYMSPLNVNYPVYRKNIYPRGTKLGGFCSTTNLSRDTRLTNRKYTEWPRNVLEYLTVKSTLNTLCTHPKTQSWSVSLYNQPFTRYTCTRLLKIRKIRNVTNDLKLTLETSHLKLPHIH